jgi:hypothetical protein
LVPSHDLAIAAGATNIQNFGFLNVDRTATSYDGKIQLVGPTESLEEISLSGPILVSGRDVGSPRDQRQFATRLRELKRKGATAILVQVEPESWLSMRGQQCDRPQIVRTQNPFPAGTWLIENVEADQEFQLRLPGVIDSQFEVRNVVGMVRGSDPELSKEAIVISAHLDHIGRSTRTEDQIFNGADDNATGVTAVMSLADAYAALDPPPKRTIVFVTFWGEEKGLLGSRYFVEHPIWPLDKIVANINIEMIGRPEAGANHKSWMTGWDQSDLGELMNRGASRVEVEFFEHLQFSRMLYRASDNASFVDKGIVAHSFSAGSLHRDYHQPGDEWQKLELKHMTAVIRGLFAGSLPIANGELTPKHSR